ncbi:MAG: NADPH:quinone reductase-like Zn-dependent oxidoreductase [Patiriisocius sp.]|jgi:NADPH:quinone reductase-like Zn-dependent oxidoreductase
MKAITTREYGVPSVLTLEEVEKPTPKDNEILVKVHSTPVTSGDARIRALNVPFGFKFITRMLFGFNKPKQPILGVVFSGLVETVGKDVKEFVVGNEVFGTSEKFGCHAQYVAIPEKGAITIKPTNLSFDDAAALPFGALTSLKYLRDLGKIKSGQKILVNGASGALGVYGIQLAKHFGAKVTGVCSGANVELVKSLGADEVIDYSTTDFTKNGKTYDIIYDTVGKITFKECKNSLSENGRMLLAASGLGQYLQVLLTSFSKKKVVAGVAVFNRKDLDVIKDLATKGIIVPVIGKRFPFSEAEAAHTYVDKGHKVGSAVVVI